MLIEKRLARWDKFRLLSGEARKLNVVFLTLEMLIKADLHEWLAVGDYDSVFRVYI